MPSGWVEAEDEPESWEGILGNNRKDQGVSRGLGMSLSPRHGEGGFSSAVCHKLSEQEEGTLLTQLLEF